MVHGFGDAAKDSIMYPLMKDGSTLCTLCEKKEIYLS